MPRKTTFAGRGKTLTPDPVDLSLVVPKAQVQLTVPALESAVEDAKAGRPFQGTVVEIAKQYHRENDKVLGVAVTKEQLRAARDAALDCIGSLDPLRVNILATVKGWKEARGKSSARGLDEVEAIISENCAKLSSLAERYEKRLLPEIAEAIEVANTETIDAAIDAWNDQCTTWHAGVLAHTKYYLFSVRECVVPPNNSQGCGKKDRIAHIEGLPSRLNDINRLSPGRLEAHVRRECAHVLRAIERAHKMEQGEKSAEETARAIARNVKGVTGFAIPSCGFPNPSAPMSQSRAAQVLEVSDDTIRRLRNNGKLRFRRLSRPRFIFCLDDAPKLASA